MISAQKAAFIRALADSSGRIEPETVIEAARPPESILHDEFEWDIETAARTTWLEQARGLIRYVRLQVTIERQTIIAPFYIPDPQRKPKSKTYLELSTAIGQRELAMKILEDEVERITSAVERARAVALVLGIGPDLDGMLAALSTIKAKAAKPKAKPKSARPKGARKKPPPPPPRMAAE
jgi:hypothetical protein